MALLTPEIRNDVVDGRIPLKQADDAPAQEPDDEARILTNGGGGEPLVAPGVPLPLDMQQPGFDMSEEP